MLHLMIDFDGTVCDTSEGVIKSAEFALEKLTYKLDKTYEEKKVIFLGPPLDYSFGKLFDDKDKVSSAVEYFRERYSKLGVLECALYDGCFEFLKKAHKNGIKLYVVSSKPDKYITQISKREGILDMFEKIYSPGFDESSHTKADLVRMALEDIKASDNSPVAIMVGDRKFDVLGAHDAGVKCVGVRWGFANDGEFEECGADYIVDTFEELYNLAVGL